MNWMEFHGNEDFFLPPAEYRTFQTDFSWRTQGPAPHHTRAVARLSGQAGSNLCQYATGNQRGLTEIMFIPIQNIYFLAGALGRLIQAECTIAHSLGCIEMPFAEFAATCLKIRESLEGKETPIVQKEAITMDEVPEVYGELYVLNDVLEKDTTRIWVQGTQPFSYNLEFAFTGKLSDLLVHLNWSNPERFQTMVKLTRMAMGGFMEALAVLVLQREISPVYGYTESLYANMVGNTAFRLDAAVPTIDESVRAL